MTSEAVEATEFLGDMAQPSPPPRTLADLAKERELRREGAQGSEQQGESGLVIDNEAVAKYSDQGALTTAKAKESTGNDRPPAAGNRTGEGKEGEQSEEVKREYWRQQYTDQRDKVASLKAKLEALNSEIAGLWSDFYRWDDPAYRDGVIKPNLDRKLEEHKQLQESIPEEEARLPEILDQARRDGALPGWFRDLIQ